MARCCVPKVKPFSSERALSAAEKKLNAELCQSWPSYDLYRKQMPLVQKMHWVDTGSYLTLTWPALQVSCILLPQIQTESKALFSIIHLCFLHSHLDSLMLFRHHGLLLTSKLVSSLGQRYRLCCVKEHGRIIVGKNNLFSQPAMLRKAWSLNSDATVNKMSCLI